MVDSGDLVRLDYFCEVFQGDLSALMRLEFLMGTEECVPCHERSTDRPVLSPVLLTVHAACLHAEALETWRVGRQLALNRFRGLVRGGTGIREQFMGSP